VKRIVIHASSFGKGNWAHYNILHDKYFINSLKKKYNVVFSNNTTIKPTDILIFIEAKSFVPKFFIFNSLSFFKKLKFIIKNLIKKSNKINQIKVEDVKKNKKILVVLEGVIHAPENHDYNLNRYFDFILTWNNELINKKNFFKINVPQHKDWPKVNQITFDKKKLITNISGNKYSNTKNQLYESRRKIIKYCEKRLKHQFDLYGFNWNEPVTYSQKIFKINTPYYRSYRGEVINKAETLSNYKFAIIYENNIHHGYVTEKIFDCLRSNCVPIYLGCPNIKKLIPANTFIDRRLFKNNEILVDYLINMSELKYNEYISNISKFLQSKDFENHFSSNIVNRIFDILK
jgi:alpha(1,3/1,4) fucosyltransferase